MLERLGPQTTGKKSLYLKDLDKVDRDVLSELIILSVTHLEDLDAN